MYFLQCVDYFFDTKLHNSVLVQSIQNAHVFFVSITCGLGLVYYANYSYAVIPYLAKLIIAQCSFDLFLSDKPDILFHHVITISMAYFSVSQFAVHYDAIQLPYAVITSTEISSFFLVLNQYFKKKSLWASLNNVGFISTFFFTRIYLYLKHVIFNDDYMDFISEMLPVDKTCWHSFIIYSFLFINMHWSSIIVKTIYKKLRNAMKSNHSFCLHEFLLQYTLFLSPIISCITYGVSTNPIFLVDIFGQSILSVNSYYYHHAVYNILKVKPKEKVCVLDDNICKSYIADIFSIQIRTFLCLFVNLSQLENSMMYLGLVASVQLIIGYFFYNYILGMKAQNRNILYNEEKILIDYLLFLPLVSVIVIGVFHNNDRDASNHLVLSSLLLYNCIVIKPFYELNHFFLHLGLLYQSYAISGINASILI